VNLTLLNERLDQIQSEIIRFQRGRAKQLLEEIEEIRLRVAAFIGSPAVQELAPACIQNLATLERAAILHAVCICQDKHKAAEALGIGVTTLYRKLSEYAEKVNK
jgi:DNA-binding NtrC family response regulator